MFNDDKTDFIVIASRHRLKKDCCQYHQVGDCDVAKMNIVQNLGAWFNDQFTIAIHITKTCSAAFYHLHNLRRIRKYLSMNAAVTLNLFLPLFLFLLLFFFFLLLFLNFWFQYVRAFWRERSYAIVKQYHVQFHPLFPDLTNC